jgi:hypothetical protein
MMERTVNERPNIHDMPFSERFKGDDWSAMSDRETCPISMIDAQLIAEGNDPFMTLEEEAKNNTERALKALTTEATELALAAIKAEHASDFRRYEVGFKFIELQVMVKASGSNLSWEKWIEVNVTTVSRATIFRYMAFARKRDQEETVTQSHGETVTPDSEPETPKATNAERQKRHREKVKAQAKATADKYVEAATPGPTSESPQETALKARAAELEDWIAALNVELQNERGHVKWLEEELELETLARKTHKSATPFTKAELRQLALAFHPDANLSVEKRTELFKLWNSKAGR